MSGKRVSFFKFGIELESDLVIVQSVAFDILKFFSDKSVHFESFAFLFGNLFDDILPSVHFLSALKLFVKGLNLFRSFRSE